MPKPKPKPPYKALVCGALMLSGVLVLGACDTVKEIPSVKAKTATEHMLALEVEYNGVFELMRQYEDLKRCSVTTSKLCSSQDVVDRMRAINTTFDTTSASAWKVIKTVNASESVKDAAVASVTVVLADAREIYNSVRNVIVGTKGN